MTQEEKAKAYDEALERAKTLYENANGMILKKWVEQVFPELAQSEDEKVRKELIDAVQGLWDNDALPIPLSVKRKDEWLAWLEKQKEYESTDFEYVWDRTDCGELTAALDKYSEEAIINMCHAWYDKGIELERKSWLEKQGQVKESAISQHENRTYEEDGNSLTSEDAIEREVKEDAGGYPYIDATELYDYENDKPLAKAGDRVKVVFINDK